MLTQAGSKSSVLRRICLAAVSIFAYVELAASAALRLLTACTEQWSAPPSDPLDDEAAPVPAGAASPISRACTPRLAAVAGCRAAPYPSPCGPRDIALGNALTSRRAESLPARRHRAPPSRAPMRRPLRWQRRGGFRLSGHMMRPALLAVIRTAVLPGLHVPCVVPGAPKET